MEKLGLTFTKRQVLTSDAMNKIVGKVNDVVDSANKLETLDLKVGGIKKDVEVLMVDRTIDEILGEETSEEDIENTLNEILS